MPLITRSELNKFEVKKSYNSYNMTETAEAKQTLLNEAAQFSESKTYDIFLSHSYSDAQIVLKVKRLIENLGFTTYVDWIDDRELDRSKVNSKTADRLRFRMKNCKSLFFMTSENSSTSKWMPWELGYFDALKNRVAILPIVDESFKQNFNGQEYLGLYDFVIKDAAIGAVKETLWIKRNNGDYVRFDLWINGSNPYSH